MQPPKSRWTQYQNELPVEPLHASETLVAVDYARRAGTVWNPRDGGSRGGSREWTYAVPPDCCCSAGGGPPNPPWPPGPPVLTPAKLKSLSTYTVTGVPSDFTMCASYMALPSASVSTRVTVPPGTFCSATAVTFDAASPVRTV